MKYEPPYTYDEVLTRYGKIVADRLAKDPVHAWRMKTGIELIHKEPTLNEQERIWKNWQLMTDKQKKISDEKSKELFGIDNAVHHKNIMATQWQEEKPLFNKFDLVYKAIMSNMLNKVGNSRSKFNLTDYVFPLFNENCYYFTEFSNEIINEDYHIFSVPRKLLDEIVSFANGTNKSSSISSNKVIKKRFGLNDILNLVDDWEYFSEFKENLDLMLKENSKCYIDCRIFSSLENAEEILKECKPMSDEITAEKIVRSYAMIYSIEDAHDFNACLCINAYSHEFKLRKIIQHELIHWMQVSLNSHTHKKHGIFNDKKFNLTDSQISEIASIMKKTKEEFKKLFEYLLNGMEFEAWTANACEEFENAGLSISDFKNIIENDKIFINMFNESGNDEQEMWLFGRLCYLTSMNDSSDDRWWYLLEALKENAELNEKLK